MSALKRSVFLTLAAAILATSTALADNVLLPKGAGFPARLETPLSSRLNQIGDTVKAAYTGAASDGFPGGTIFKGKITQVSAKTSKEHGTVTVVFTQAVLPNGKKIAIQGVPSLSKDSNAAATSSKDKKKNTGKGAAAGALGGMLLFHNDLTGALIGGALGGGIASVTGKKKTDDLEVKSGTPFFIVLTQSVTVPAPKSASSR